MLNKIIILGKPNVGKSSIFNLIVKKNIALGLDIKKISEDKLIKAANAAQISKFVKNPFPK